MPARWRRTRWSPLAAWCLVLASHRPDRELAWAFRVAPRCLAGPGGGHLTHMKAVSRRSPIYTNQCASFHPRVHAKKEELTRHQRSRRERLCGNAFSSVGVAVFASARDDDWDDDDDDLDDEDMAYLTSGEAMSALQASANFEAMVFPRGPDRRKKKVILDIDVVADTLGVEGELALRFLQQMLPSSSEQTSSSSEEEEEEAAGDPPHKGDDEQHPWACIKSLTRDAPEIRATFDKVASALQLTRQSELCVLLRLLFEEAQVEQTSDKGTRRLQPREIIENWHEVLLARCLARWPSNLRDLDDIDRRTHDFERTEDVHYRKDVMEALRDAAQRGLVDEQFFVAVRADSVLTSHVSYDGWDAGSRALLPEDRFEEKVKKRNATRSAVRSGEPLFVMFDSPPHLTDLCRGLATSPEHPVGGVLYFGPAAGSLSYAVASGWRDWVDNHDAEMYVPKHSAHRVRSYRCGWANRWTGSSTTSLSSVLGAALGSTAFSNDGGKTGATELSSLGATGATRALMADLAAAKKGSSLVTRQQGGQRGKNKARRGKSSSSASLGPTLDVTLLDSVQRDFRDALGLPP